MWDGNDASETTHSVSVTATMTDLSTQSQTLTFKVAAGNATCPSGGGPASATWPAVLTPDRPFHTQDLLSSDSATRPYAISDESGALYVGHSLPAYQPGGPLDGLLASVGQPPSLSAPVVG